MAVLGLKSQQRGQTEHHLPEGGNSFHWAEQAKQTLPTVWSSQGSRGQLTHTHTHRCFHLEEDHMTITLMP